MKTSIRIRDNEYLFAFDNIQYPQKEADQQPMRCLEMELLPFILLLESIFLRFLDIRIEA